MDAYSDQIVFTRAPHTPDPDTTRVAVSPLYNITKIWSQAHAIMEETDELKDALEAQIIR